MSSLTGFTTQDGDPPDFMEETLSAAQTRVLTEDTFGLEPGIEVASDGTIYVTAPSGKRNGGGIYARERSRIWISRDDGETFQEVPAIAASGVSNLPLGLEGDLALDPKGLIYFTDLTIAGATVSRSVDQGRTWEARTVSPFLVPTGDRAWIAAGEDNVVAATWNNLPFSPEVRTAVVAVSRDGGRTFPTQTRLDAASTPASPITIGPEGILYVARSQPEGVVLFRSRDGGASFERFLVHETRARTDFIFVTPAVDSAGNVYVAWVEDRNGNSQAFVAASQDHGETFRDPLLVSFHGGSTAFPWIAAQDPGHVAIAFYGAPGVQGLPDELTADWFPFVTEIQEALSQSPRFRFGRAAHEPVLHGSICTGGTTSCSSGSQSSSRALGDFFQVAFGPDGDIHATWNDDQLHVNWAVLT